MSTPATLARASPLSGCTWPLSLHDILSRPLPSAGGIVDRLLLRAAVIAAQRQVLVVHGLEHVMPERDPFILALNHSTRLEALLVPALLMHARGGRRVHFLADWNFALIPGIGLLYRRSGAICVTRKPARLRILNVFKKSFETGEKPFAAAKAHLLEGHSIGVFPEGTANRHPSQLLRGRFGAARLSLETGVPVVPAGLRYSVDGEATQIPETASFALHVGPALYPAGVQGGRSPHARVKSWHMHVMTAISQLSGKSWTPNSESAHLGGKPCE